MNPVNQNECGQSDQFEFSIRMNPVYPNQSEWFRKIWIDYEWASDNSD